MCTIATTEKTSNASSFGLTNVVNVATKEEQTQSVSITASPLMTFRGFSLTFCCSVRLVLSVEKWVSFLYCVLFYVYFLSFMFSFSFQQPERRKNKIFSKKNWVHEYLMISAWTNRIEFEVRNSRWCQNLDHTAIFTVYYV